MQIQLVAKVRAVTGRTKHYLGTVIDGQPVPLQELPTPVRVEILEDEFGYFLFSYDANGSCVSDSWFPSLDEAKRQAEFEFAIGEEDWQALP